MNGRGDSRLGRVGAWVLAFELVFAGLALGSLHTGVLAVTATLAAAAVGLTWYGSPPLQARPAATTLVVLATVLVVWTAFQALPLPASVVASLAPENADVWARSLSPLRESGPRWVTISLDPGATRVEVLRGLTYLFTLLAALRVAQRQEGVVFLERVVVGAAVLMSAAALLHPAFGAQKVFGAYAPVNRTAFTAKNLAPLLNTNHLAAYMNIGFCVAFATTIRRHEASIPRPIAAAAAALLVATNLYSRSRGGAGALLVGASLISAVTVLARKRERGKALLVLGPSVAVLGAAAMTALAWSDDAMSKLQSKNTEKLRIGLESMELVKRSAIAGIGRGSFESVFPSVRQGLGHWVFTHPENVLAQWTTEWGVPFAILAMAAIVWALRPASMLARSHPPVGAWAALVVVALQNLVDFSSEVPGVMVLLAACAGVVVGGTAGREQRSRIEGWSRRPRALALATAPALVLALAATVPFTSVELTNEQRRFYELGIDRSLTKASFDPQVRAAMTRHPAEPYFAFVGALRASTVRDDAVLPWAARALERSPVSGRTHLLLARDLFRSHPAQARLEYRLALEQDSNLVYLIAPEIPPLVGSFDDALEATPAGEAGVGLLEPLSMALRLRLPATSARLDREILERSTSGASRWLPLERAANGALQDLKDGAPWCGPDGRECFEEGMGAARLVLASENKGCAGQILVAKLEMAAGRIERGLAELERAVDTAVEKSVCVRALVSLAAETGQRYRVDAALDRITRIGCTASECVENLTFAAEVERSRNNGRRALALYRTAAERAPERDDLLETLASLATAQGLPGEALDAYAKLAARHPGDAKYEAGVASARAAVQRGIADRVQR